MEKGDDVLRELCAGVIAAPDDDRPRMVLADWFLERGDPRGELISIQCQLGSVATTYSTKVELRQRATRILESQSGSWHKELGASAKARYERGFIEELELEVNVKGFFEIAEGIFEKEPIRKLSLLGCEASHIEALLSAPWIGRLRSLKLRPGGAKGKLSAKALKAIASADSLSALRGLNLNGCGITASQAKVLAKSKTLLNLEMLALSGNEIADEGLEALASTELLGRCQELYLSRDEVTDEGAQIIAKAPSLGQVRKLGLDLNEITDVGLGAIVDSKTLISLRRLEMGGGFFDAALVKKAKARFKIFKS